MRMSRWLMFRSPMSIARGLVAMCCLLISSAAPAQDVLRGHGGPVRGLAMGAETRLLVSGGFDHVVIEWDLARNAARRVLRFHDGAVNAVAMLGGDCFASASEDTRIAIWCGDGVAPLRVLTGHNGPVTALAAVPGDGGRLASASFDGTVRLWDSARGDGTAAARRSQIARDGAGGICCRRLFRRRGRHDHREPAR